MAATTEGPSSSSSKPKQRSRKGKSREISESLESAGANSVQAEDVSRESQTRMRTKQARRGDSEVSGADAGQSVQLMPAEGSKNSRPRARPLNRSRQTPSSSDPSQLPQNISQAQLTAASEAAARDTMDSSPASLSVKRATGEGSREDRARPSRKRPNTTSRSKLNYADKRQKTSVQPQVHANEEANGPLGADCVEKCKYILMLSAASLTNVY